jgi:hypothetical protein
MLTANAHRQNADDSHQPSFALLIDIEVNTAHRAEIIQRFHDYLQQLRQLFQDGSGYLGAELHASGEHHLLGRLHWRRREDWVAAWDCQRTRNQLFADSLLRLGARSIQFDSILLDENR